MIAWIKNKLAARDTLRARAQLLELYRLQGHQIIDLHSLFLAFAQSQAGAVKLLFRASSGLTQQQRADMVQIQSRCETSIEHLEKSLEDFRKAFESMPKQ